MAETDSYPRTYLSRVARVTIVVTALVLAGWFGVLLHATFHQPVEVADTKFGTADAPYSDAMGPWLDSSMSFYVRGVPLGYLYRPTVGLFYSTLISLTGSIAALPVIWIVLFFALCGALFAVTDWPHRVGLLGIMAVGVIFFEELIRPLNPETLMVDFWPMAMSLAAIWLIALGEAGEPRPLSATAAGFILLGIAGCVRGPQLASGAALLALLAPGRIRRRQWLALALMAACFAAPSVIDSVVRKWYGIGANTATTLYAVYSDPLHTWTLSSEARYLQEKPHLGEICSHYLGFLLSRQGATIFCTNCAAVLSHALDLATKDVFLQALAALAVLSWLAGGNPAALPPPSSEWQWGRRLALVGLIVAAAAVLCLDTGFRVPIFAVLIGALGLHAILTGRRLTAMLVVAFCGALVFHAALGLVDGLRIYTGYEVLLVAAFVMAVSEKPHTASPKPRQLSGVSIIVFVLILVGYTGNYWLRSGYKAGLRQALASPHTAMKISGNLPLDRSLYMRGDGVEFYTRYDPLPFGTVRHYGRLDTPEGIGCPTFIHPCFVEWN